MRLRVGHAALLLAFAWLCPAKAATCRDPAGFDAFVANFKQEAAANGISALAVSALDDITYDPSIVARDHGQHVFHQSFEQFAGRMVNSYRLRKGAALMKKYADVFAKVEQTYGVPAPVIVAIWGLETDFGAVMGNSPTLQSLATLAFDCRRSAKFQEELMDALRLIDRGDLSPDARGAWAGEVGQTQFLPSSYLKFGVDFGGNGHSDLINNVPDVLASTANFLRSYGWERGASWSPGSANFAVIKEWNKADVYARTIAYFASKLAGDE